MPLGSSILVIEDNKDNMELIAYLLRAHGYAPRLAHSGVEGVRLALEDPPELILLDIRMPDMDGYEVAAALVGLHDTYIVAVTASAMVEDRARIVEAGIQGYMQKPIDVETFVEQLERFLTEAAGSTGRPV